jgi:hypothetical protein
MLAESTLELLAEPWLGQGDLDSTVRYLLEGEYMRRMVGYLRTDRALAQKYGMTFEEFMAQRVVQQRGYTWEVEKDAMDWTLAVDGIQTIEDKLRELLTCDWRPKKRWQGCGLFSQLPEGLEPKPLLKFLTRVEGLLLRYSLLYPTIAD